jgi:hypothetical protein
MHKCAIVRIQYYLPYFMIILAIYLVDADAEIRRFHDVKTEWGFNKFLPFDSFNCHCNGYLVNDCCVIGVEVFVHERSGKREFLSLIKQAPNGVMTWKLENFSALNKAAYYSQVFIIGDLKWYFYYWKFHFYCYKKESYH